MPTVSPATESGRHVVESARIAHRLFHVQFHDELTRFIRFGGGDAVVEIGARATEALVRKRLVTSRMWLSRPHHS